MVSKKIRNLFFGGNSSQENIRDLILSISRYKLVFSSALQHRVYDNPDRLLLNFFLEFMFKVRPIETNKFRYLSFEYKFPSTCMFVFLF